MAAITTTTITNISASRFRGGRGLTDEAGDYSLAALVNAYLTKLREVITRWNAGTLDMARVNSTSFGNYAAGNMSWMDIDGTNPPFFPRFRMYDANGTIRTVTISGAGAWVIT